MPFLIVDVRHDPEFMTSPPYRALMAWCEVEGIPLVTGWTLTVEESPPSAVLDVINLDEDGQWVLDENSVPVTHPVAFTPSTPTPVSGHLGRAGST